MTSRRSAIVRWLVYATIAASTLACDESKSDTSKKTTETAGEVAGDDAEEAAPPEPKIVHAEGPAPTDTTVIASAGDLKVTMADFDQASQISLLFAPDGVTELPPERLALPHVHMTMTRSLLSQKAILREVERRGLTPDEDALVKWLSEHDKLGQYGKLMDTPQILNQRLKPLGLTRDDLLQVARAEVAKERLADALLEEVEDDEIWDVYRTEKTTRTVAMVSTTNLPSSEEIDEYVANHPADIDEYFQKNPNRFRIPRRVTVNLVRPEPGTDVDDATMKKAAAELRQGIQPVTVARHFELEYEEDVNMVKGENPEAFGSEPGSVGWVPDGPRGAIAWKVVGFQPSRLPEMSRPLRREIAAEMLRKNEVAPSVEKSLAGALEKVQNTDLKDEAKVDALEKEIEASGDIDFEITTFPNAPNKALSNHGLAEEVIEAAFETDVSETAGPLLSREKGFAFVVLDKSTASKKEFRKNLKANREAYLDALRPRVVQMWVQKKLNELGPSLDVQPLRIRYGVLQK